MQHYTEDPLMDGPRREHQLLLEPVGTTTGVLITAALFAAGCAAGDWMDPRPYDLHAHMEGFDQHMGEVQRKVHETEASEASQGDRPDEEA
ncbi:hypothetical protein [Streptomyces tirandamycinicus]|uniref:Uncharacterized protein n=1 Tax=Streptomyces tirandamycinicus TaxID=2174846 RepID=A0A2S1T220_9ACTN|nr:hypothetical protein [Streptomyces tirandamycinicus]AWI32724.1 hypothetical protein DDW44_30900 [Streptomyces tirandamycinicus]